MSREQEHDDLRYRLLAQIDDETFTDVMTTHEALDFLEALIDDLQTRANALRSDLGRDR